MERLRINLTGCSGIGKTTLAKAISEEYGIPFISGSYSDLVPETKNIPHTDMIQQDAKTIFEQDVMVLNRRNQAFKVAEQYISDRSYIDSAAYMINKLSHRLPECEIEDFIEKCRVLTLQQCPLVIFVPFTTDYFSQWKMEDNGKRILNGFYQAEITTIINWLIYDFWDGSLIDLHEGNDVVELPINTHDQNSDMASKILILRDIPHEQRMKTINWFINRYK